MSIIIPKHASNVEGSGPSPIIWADCPVVTYLKDSGKGLYLFEDFIGNFTADEVIISPHFLLVGTTPDIDVVTDEIHGVVEIEGSGSGDDEAYLVSNTLYELKMESGERMWFEAKLKIENVDGDDAFICGLGEAAIRAADAIADDNSGNTDLANYDFVGFHAGCDGTNMDDIDCIYHEVGDGGTITRIAEAFDNADLVDDTYIRLGMTYDGQHLVKYYANGVLVGSFDVDDLDTGTANQFTNKLGIIVGIKNLAGTANFCALDWIRFACEK